MKNTFWRVLSCLLLLSLVGCDDSAGGGEAIDSSPRQAQDDAGRRQLSDAGAKSDAQMNPTDATAVDGAADQGAPADAGPPPECVGDDNCGDGRICFNDECVDGTRCDDGQCASGRVCVGGLCIADPNSTGGLTIEPDILVFSFSEVGDEASRQVTLTNEGDAILNITGLRFEGAPVFALDGEQPLPIRLVPSQSHPMLIRHVPNDLIADQGTLLVTTDQPGAPAEVRLISESKPIGGADPCLRVIPVRLNFGAIQRGDTTSRDFELISCGQVPVTITGINRGVFFVPLPDTFQLDNPPAFPLVLAAGARQIITSSYSPRRAGPEFGFWNVLSTDPANPEIRVDVNAIGEPPPLAEVELHVRLAWDTDLTDVDLHLLAPNGRMWSCDDCFFQNPQPEWGDPNQFEDNPFLDLDDVDGFGPENINLETPQPGTYRVLVHYYDDHDGDVPNATIEVLNFGQVIGRYGPVQLNSVDDTWEVVDIEFPALNLTPLGAVNQTNANNICAGI